MRKQPKERTPCESCGIGIVGAHMKRHSGSKVCQRMQQAQRYTVQMFPNARLVEKLRAGWDPGAVSEGIARLLEGGR